MKVPLSWVNKLVDIEEINLDLLIEKLTLAGFEVEEKLIKVINEKSEIILDLSATANRSDSLSIYGISKEIAAILNKPTKISNDILKENIKFSILDSINEIEQINLNCSDFITCEIATQNLKETPEWIKHKLLCCEITPENSIIDLFTYILLETGYPFQFYDLDKILKLVGTDQFDLSIRKLPSNEKFNLRINNSVVNFESNDITLGLYANTSLIGLPGIVEEEKVSICNKTNKFLIEGSIFNSKYIRQSARKLGLRTERSARYEKGINNSYFLSAYSRLLELFKLYDSNLTIKGHNKFLSPKLKPNNISLNLNKIHEILGPVNVTNNKKIYLSNEQIQSYFTRLDFKIVEKTNNLWVIAIPTIRNDDIIQEIDLIEEIGRLHGFNNFVTQLPNLNQIGIEDNSYKFRKKLNSCFLAEGLNEILNYSLVESFYKNEIKLTNPLISDCSVLRKSLLPNLIKNCSENAKQGNLIFDGFEYGHIFELDKTKVYKEIEMVSGIFGNFAQRNSWDEATLSFSWFEAKGKIENLFEKIALKTQWEKTIDAKYENIFHPFKSATILNKKTGTIVGIFGQLNISFAEKYSIPANLYLFEFNFGELKNNDLNNELPMYLNYSPYPKVTKDISFIINNNISFETIQNYIYQINSDLLINIELLDKYDGKSIPLNHTSLCIKLTFQSKFKTLKTNDIDKLVEKIEKGLQINFDSKIRN